MDESHIYRPLQLSDIATLPPHCEPSNRFLRNFSSLFHTCIPTTLAFISTVLGFLSIACWFFAQLPQIVKNQRLRSTSGLSAFFLIEWCLGDLSNLLGALLTEQALWQILVAAYYCTVDLVLVGQWVWFEGLGKGRSYRPRKHQDGNEYRTIRKEEDKSRGEGMEEVGQERSSDEVSQSTDCGDAAQDLTNNGNTPSSPFDSAIASRQGSSGGASSNRGAQIENGNPFPNQSSRTVLFITLLIALCSQTTVVGASPTDLSVLKSHLRPSSPHETLSVGTLLAWLSTILYLFSRLPQILKNFRRRSTAGLSPLLFIAAFGGNFFYSTSLLCNPYLWDNFQPYGGGGWAGPNGSNRGEWAIRSLPFFLGAAGVLFMDGAVGIQFCIWGDGAIEARKKRQLALQNAIDDLEREQSSAAALRTSSANLDNTTTSSAVSTGGRQGMHTSAKPIPSRSRHLQGRSTGWMRGWVPGSPFSYLPSFSPRSSAALVAAQGDSSSDSSATLVEGDTSQTLESSTIRRDTERTSLLGAQLRGKKN